MNESYVVRANGPYAAMSDDIIRAYERYSSFKVGWRQSEGHLSLLKMGDQPGFKLKLDADWLIDHLDDKGGEREVSNAGELFETQGMSAIDMGRGAHHITRVVQRLAPFVRPRKAKDSGRSLRLELEIEVGRPITSTHKYRSRERFEGWLYWTKIEVSPRDLKEFFRLYPRRAQAAELTRRLGGILDEKDAPFFKDPSPPRPLKGETA